MNDHVLAHFRDIADAMAGPEPRNWQWVGQYISQRYFGITESRAKDMAARHGGEASRMTDEPGGRLNTKGDQG